MFLDRISSLCCVEQLLRKCAACPANEVNVTTTRPDGFMMQWKEVVRRLCTEDVVAMITTLPHRTNVRVSAATRASLKRKSSMLVSVQVLFTLKI